MIDPIEVRLGNLFSENGQIKEVEGIDIYFGEILIEDRNMDDGFRRARNPEPIPITWEWLRKFGIENYDDEYFQLINGKKIFTLYGYSESLQDSGVFYIPFVTGPDVEIKYVHQLQNLYFALTGQELELK